jgi:hypothetical protein
MSDFGPLLQVPPPPPPLRNDSAERLIQDLVDGLDVLERRTLSAGHRHHHRRRLYITSDDKVTACICSGRQRCYPQRLPFPLTAQSR